MNGLISFGCLLGKKGDIILFSLQNILLRLVEHLRIECFKDEKIIVLRKLRMSLATHIYFNSPIPIDLLINTHIEQTGHYSTLSWPLVSHHSHSSAHIVPTRTLCLIRWIHRF